MTHRRALLAAFLVALSACAGRATGGDPGTDLLVFAPHPDDETLGTAGAILETLSRGGRVKIVLFTSGDGFPAAASLVAKKPVERLGPEDFLELARFRQAQAERALRALGGDPADLVFLGYPDAGLDQVYLAKGEAPFRQRFTGKTRTYGAGRPDYHTAAHGRAAPYTYASVLADVVELLEKTRPARVLVTGEADRHADHQAAFRFVRDAVRATGWRGLFETYLIHGGPEWPWPPGPTPEARLEAHDVKGQRVPLGVPWPPPTRVPLSARECRLKLDAIRAHASHLEGAGPGPMAEERAYLESFVKSEEVFWPAEYVPPYSELLPSYLTSHMSPAKRSFRRSPSPRFFFTSAI